VPGHSEEQCAQVARCGAWTMRKHRTTPVQVGDVGLGSEANWAVKHYKNNVHGWRDVGFGQSSTWAVRHYRTVCAGVASQQGAAPDHSQINGCHRLRRDVQASTRHYRTTCAGSIGFPPVQSHRRMDHCRHRLASPTHGSSMRCLFSCE
jgi:hypothetical protein